MKALWLLVSTPRFSRSVLSTMARGLAGFGVSFLCGAALGLAAGKSGVLRGLLDPAVAVIRSVPVMAIILLAMIWFRAGSVPVFVGVLVGFPIVFSSVVEGVRSIDRRLLEMARAYGLGSWRTLLSVSVPSLLPFLMSAASSALGLTWRVVVGAEVLSQPLHAIGTGLQTAQARLETDEVFAWTVVAVVVGACAELGLRALLRLPGWWRSRGHRR